MTIAPIPIESMNWTPVIILFAIAIVILSGIVLAVDTELKRGYDGWFLGPRKRDGGET